MPYTINLSEIPENPSQFSDLSPRSSVKEVMAISEEISHIEADLGNNVIIEMECGIWLGIPKSAIIKI